MAYSIQQLAQIAGVTVRTLHYYDEIGLLSPKRKSNDYRVYEKTELLKLQQIMFFTELDFSLNEIKKILSSPSFNIKDVLKDQRKLIEIKKKRLSKLIKTINKTINNLNKKTNMKDHELYGNFSREESIKYAKEAKERWGNTDAYKQSQERVKKLGKEGMRKFREESEMNTKAISECLKEGRSSKDPKVQKLIKKHYEGLRVFYEPNLKIYKGLAEMYVGDERFKAYYDKFTFGLAIFMRDAMLEFIKTVNQKGV